MFNLAHWTYNLPISPPPYRLYAINPHDPKDSLLIEADHPETAFLHTLLWSIGYQPLSQPPNPLPEKIMRFLNTSEKNMAWTPQKQHWVWLNPPIHVMMKDPNIKRTFFHAWNPRPHL